MAWRGYKKWDDFKTSWFLVNIKPVRHRPIALNFELDRAMNQRIVTLHFLRRRTKYVAVILPTDRRTDGRTDGGGRIGALSFHDVRAKNATFFLSFALC